MGLYTAKVGALSPLALVWTGSVSDAVPDLSIVTAGRFDFRRANGTTGSWTASITSQTAISIVLRHPWVSGDLSSREIITVWAALTMPSGEVPSVSFPIDVQLR